MAAGTRRSRPGSDPDHGTGRDHAHGHSHSHGPAEPASPRLRRLVALLLTPVALAAVAGLVLLWPSAASHATTTRAGEVWVNGTVTASSVAATSAEAKASGTTDATTNTLTVRVTSGPTKGATVHVTVGVDAATPVYGVGDDLVLTYATKPIPGGTPDDQYELRDFQRGPPLASLAIAFALVIVLVGRWKGLGAIAALGASFLLLVKFMLPAIVAGENAVAVAAVGAGIILFVAFYATHGLSVRTSVAVIGTAVSLALIGLLGSVATDLAHLTGLGTDDAANVAGLFGKVDVKGLLLAGVIVGALGVLNDVTITQVSAVWELKRADPDLSTTELIVAGMRIGRDHIGATVNTLVLAYAGASLPLLVLMSNSGQSWSNSGSAEVVAEEIVRTLVGSIGLAAAVPVTTALAAWFAAGEEPDDRRFEFEDLREEPRAARPRPVSRPAAPPRPRTAESGAGTGRRGVPRQAADRYADPGYADPGYADPGYADPGYPRARYAEDGYSDRYDDRGHLD